MWSAFWWYAVSNQIHWFIFPCTLYAYQKVYSMQSTFECDDSGSISMLLSHNNARTAIYISSNSKFEWFGIKKTAAECIPGPCSYIHIASVCQTICLSLSTGLETKAPFAPRPLTMTNGKVTLKNAGSECGIIDQPRLNCLCVCVCLRTCDTNARHAIKAKQFIKSVEYVNRNGKKKYINTCYANGQWW